MFGHIVDLEINTSSHIMYVGWCILSIKYVEACVFWLAPAKGNKRVNKHLTYRQSNHIPKVRKKTFASTIADKRQANRFICFSRWGFEQIKRKGHVAALALKCVRPRRTYFSRDAIGSSIYNTNGVSSWNIQWTLTEIETWLSNAFRKAIVIFYLRSFIHL